MSCTLDEDTLDELDRRGVPDELVADWLTLETRCLGLAEDVSQAPAQLPMASRRYAKWGRMLSVLLAPFLLPTRPDAALRRNALQWLWCLCGQCRDSWFRAVALFDIHGRLSPGRHLADCLPHHCMAIIQLLAKLDGEFEHLQWLISDKIDDQASLNIIAQERAVFLQSVGFLRQPSLTEWLSVLCARMRTFAPRLIGQRCVEKEVDEALGKAKEVAWTLLWQDEVSTHVPYSQAAIALFACALVRGRLLPLEVLRPADLSFLDWSALFCLGHREAEVPECALETGEWLLVLSALEVTTGCASATLSQHARSIMRIVAGIS